VKNQALLISKKEKKKNLQLMSLLKELLKLKLKELSLRVKNQKNQNNQNLLVKLYQRVVKKAVKNVILYLRIQMTSK